MAEKRGIDISRYQGKPDFGKLKSAVDFVIVQAGFGRYTSQVDAEFERNYAECRKNGIPVGAYWFGYALTPADARAEAQACMQALKGKTFDYPIYYDMETDVQSNHYPFATGKANCTAMVKAFCGELEKNGYYAGLYISRSPCQDYIEKSTAARYALWIADYADKCYYNGDVGIWQYSSMGQVNGISTKVDMDICYEDYPKIIKQGGFNNYPKADPKPLDTEGFKRGDKSLGVYYLKQRLRAKGYKVDDTEGFGGGTENAVNEILTARGYEPNGIAGKGFARLVMR